MKISRRRFSHRGFSLLMVVGALAILTMLGQSLLSQATANYNQGGRLRSRISLNQMQDGALARTRVEIGRASNWKGVEKIALGQGEVSIQMVSVNGQSAACITAAIPTLEQPRYSETRTISLAH